MERREAQTRWQDQPILRDDGQLSSTSACVTVKIKDANPGWRIVADPTGGAKRAYPLGMTDEQVARWIAEMPAR